GRGVGARHRGRHDPREPRHARDRSRAPRALREIRADRQGRSRPQQFVRLRRLELQPRAGTPGRLMALTARVEGVGLVGPGLSGWEVARAILAGREQYVHAATVIPAPEALPAVERRRAGKSVKLALAAGMAAATASGRAVGDLAAVFASSTGDGENLHAICEALASPDRLISPTRFHNSVHNAPSGYWGIATGATQAADSLAAFDASFAA